MVNRNLFVPNRIATIWNPQAPEKLPLVDDMLEKMFDKYQILQL